jgi:hypothetical protein
MAQRSPEITLVPAGGEEQPYNQPALRHVPHINLHYIE